MQIDLNADLGESVGTRVTGDDSAMLEVVSSASVACGFHAGDPATMRRVVTEAAERGVAVGAHVAYPDTEGFGRRPLAMPAAELSATVVYQLGALQAICAAAGTRVRYVKPHGALYNAIVHDRVQAAAVVEAIIDVDPGLPLLGLPGSAVLRLAEEAGLPSVTEAFADRAYTPEGTLLPRSHPGAVLHDPDLIAARMIRLVRDGIVTAVDGSDIAMAASSICVHGDSPGAVAIARRLRAALTEAGALIRAFA